MLHIEVAVVPMPPDVLANLIQMMIDMKVAEDRQKTQVSVG